MGIRSMDLVERLAAPDCVIPRLPEEMRGGEQVREGGKRHCPVRRGKPQGRVTEMTVGQLRDYADPAQRRPYLVQPLHVQRSEALARGRRAGLGD